MQEFDVFMFQQMYTMYFMIPRKRRKKMVFLIDMQIYYTTSCAFFLSNIYIYIFSSQLCKMHTHFSQKKTSTRRKMMRRESEKKKMKCLKRSENASKWDELNIYLSYFWLQANGMRERGEPKEWTKNVYYTIRRRRRMMKELQRVRHVCSHVRLTKRSPPSLTCQERDAHWKARLSLSLFLVSYRDEFPVFCLCLYMWACVPVFMEGWVESSRVEWKRCEPLFSPKKWPKHALIYIYIFLWCLEMHWNVET